LFSGTIVVTGAVSGVVVATGAATELGVISSLLRAAKAPETPLSRTLRDLGVRLTRVIVAVALFTFRLALLRGFPLYDAVRSGVSLACAAIPEGLPATITIALAAAVRRMAARHAIVRTLPSVETLGSTTVVCSDKTGTLTRGEMTVRSLGTHLVLYELTA